MIHISIVLVQIHFKIIYKYPKLEESTDGDLSEFKVNPYLIRPTRFGPWLRRMFVLPEESKYLYGQISFYYRLHYTWPLESVQSFRRESIIDRQLISNLE